MTQNVTSPARELIRFTGLSKWYDTPAGRYTALKGIDLSIRAGEYAAIVGKSGSGKSTLLNMITGIDHPSEGGAVIAGSTIHSFSEGKLAEWRGKNIGIVFQFFQLIPTLTVRENILLAMEFVNCVPKEKRADRVANLLEQTGIAKHADKFPTALSGGEQQRAAIARALANNPPLLVADEPTGNLDSNTAASIQNLFARLADDGKTVIVVTHERASDAGYRRILTISDGTISGDTGSVAK